MADASVETAVALYAAFAAGDRARAEALLAPDFHFTSPRDNHIDRAAWFARCWPGSAEAAGFTVVRTGAPARWSTSPTK